MRNFTALVKPRGNFGVRISLPLHWHAERLHIPSHPWLSLTTFVLQERLCSLPSAIFWASDSWDLASPTLYETEAERQLALEMSSRPAAHLCHI